MPTALRFWDKLGLGPKSGKKDVTVFVLYEQGYHEAEQHDRLGKAKIWRDEQIGSWLRNVCALYKVGLFSWRLATFDMNNVPFDR